VQEIEVASLPPDRFDELVPGPCMDEFGAELTDGRGALGDGVLWHVNSTATGGGVAEMLQSVLCYLVGAGIKTRWGAVDGDDEFFVVTKRIHHMLHGKPGDGGALGEAEQEIYLASLARELGSLLEVVRSGDVVFLHDPQTLGLAQPLKEAGAHLVWTCHVGVDEPGDTARTAWEFLLPHVLRCDAQVFSRPQYVWEGLDPGRVEIIPPCIDVFSPKNQALEDGTVAAILGQASIVCDGAAGEPVFTRQDGEAGQVTAAARMVEDAPVPGDAPVVTQISRWDPLKDHRGVMTAFAEHVPQELGAHLILAGPAPESVGDDPEGQQVLDDLLEAWHGLPSGVRGRVHVACLPMDDVEENAAIVNALQRRSTVIVQKSLAEGFGLTVAEAMWKARPVAASRVGGIQDQIDHGKTGVLVDDPSDLPELGRALTTLLEDADEAGRLGRAAHESVADRYLVPRYLSRYLRIVREIVA
jgi:trehalose synthase